MAAQKISELPVVTAAPGNSWIVINVGGITSRIRKSDLLSRVLRLLPAWPGGFLVLNWCRQGRTSERSGI